MSHPSSLISIIRKISLSILIRLYLDKAENSNYVPGQTHQRTDICLYRAPVELNMLFRGRSGWDPGSNRVKANEVEVSKSVGTREYLSHGLEEEQK